MGIIAVEGIRKKAPVGVSKEERLVGSDIQIDIYIHTKNRLNYSSLDEGLDYSLINDIGRKGLNKESLLLEEIIQYLEMRLRVLVDAKGLSHQCSYCVIRISKWNPPLSGEVSRTYIEDKFEF